MILSYSTWGMPSVPIDKALEYLASLGFDGVEPTVLPGYTTELDTLDAAERRRIRQLCDRYGLEMPAVAGHRSLLDQDSASHAENMRRLRGAVDLCADWADGAGHPVLDTVSGGRPEDWDPLRAFILDRVGELVHYAAPRGVVIAIEAHIGAALDTPDKCVWLVETINSPFLKLNFDISHFVILGLPTAETVAELAPYAAHTHVKDQRGRVPDFAFLIPGEGDFDYVTYLKAMRKAGYTGSITAEVSYMAQGRPGYDPMAAAELTYRTLDRAFKEAGISR